VPMGGWDTTPECIQHGVPGSDGVYRPYEKCADFFTFGPGGKFGTFSDGVATSYWVLTALGFVVSIAFLVGWVMLEDRKLKRQAAYLIREGVAKTVHEELVG